MNPQDPKYQQKSKAISSAEPNYLSQFEMRYPVSVALRSVNLSRAIFFGTPILVAVGSSGILKGKQKLGVIFHFDKLGGIDFTNFSELTMCSA